MKFKVKAINKEKKKAEFEFEAEDRKGAIASLRSQGFLILEMNESIDDHEENSVESIPVASDDAKQKVPNSASTKPQANTTNAPYCKLCKREVSPKRDIGIGTLLLVLITGGFWLFTIPFYRKRCPICKSTELVDSPKSPPPKWAVLVMGFFVFSAIVAGFSSNKPESKISTQNASAEVSATTEQQGALKTQFNDSITKTSDVSSEKTIVQLSSRIESCLKDNTCTFQLRGEATSSPTMSFIVLESKWREFNENDKSLLREQLKAKIADAKYYPENYTEIPRSAPFYPIAVANIKNTNEYSVILSSGLSENGYLRIDKEVLINF